jgi:hypothetical protein
VHRIAFYLQEDQQNTSSTTVAAGYLTLDAVLCLRAR